MMDAFSLLLFLGGSAVACFTIALVVALRFLRRRHDWSLNPGQMVFMFQQRNAIGQAVGEADWDFADRLMATEEWQRLFGDMGFDEALDRYECMLSGDDD